MMTQKEFDSKLIAVLRERLPGFAISALQAAGREPTCDLMLCGAITGRGFTIPANKMYGIYRKYGSFDAVVNTIAAVARMADGQVQGPSGARYLWDSYGAIKDRLFLKLISIRENKELLQNIPYTQYENMALTYHLFAGQASGAIFSRDITNKDLALYKIDTKQLHEDALRSAPKLFPPVIRSMTELIAASMVMGYPWLPSGAYQESRKGLCGYQITTTAEMNGAAAICYDGVLEKLADQLGSDLYVLPSSVDDVIVYPTKEISTDVGVLRNIVIGINSDPMAVPLGKKLTDSVYKYIRQSKRFVIVK